MGVGSGYHITLSDCYVEKLAGIYPQDIVNLKRTKKSAVITIKTDIDIVATVSYNHPYHYGEFEDVPLIITKVDFDLGFGEGYNKYLLNDQAIAKYEEMFGSDIEDLWEELCEVVTVEDLDLDFIRNELSEGSYYDGDSDTLSVGWSHVTFNGEFTVKNLNMENAYSSIMSATGYINNDAIVNLIDRGVQGEFDEDDEY